MSDESQTSSLYKLPTYIQLTSVLICAIIIIVGFAGNIMVLIVVIRGKDMSNSTNIFLVNLSIADLCVLLVCTPAILVEVNTGPQIWVLGENMCRAMPFVEATVAHTSVLTILAISFERYYAICKPLRANYVCTKSRAALICLLTWIAAGLLTSPFLFMVNFEFDHDDDSASDREAIPICTTEARDTWSVVYISMTIVVFFFLPVIVLIVLYSAITHQLIHRSRIKYDSTAGANLYYQQNRYQVIRMLCAVILAFFLCLLPFRLMMLWIVFSPLQKILDFGVERYFCLLYFCRIMFYLNSALNPILYTIMSSKFKKGIMHLFV
ncbi:unnamed protein product [Trichogramma brassicae]|uniref:G-protein coupled receptors family 1 profile domain-containing protein n=1 Tax=Trichogramma brassicae TaxID=86971 RepID=A0A6H5IHG2_9HYME|nr:unnamed protein product [Trichogramma brassicae]